MKKPESKHMLYADLTRRLSTNYFPLPSYSGHIPLRQLVYRVHPLPESMKPLMWDFGQLNEPTEQAYAKQIILRYVSSLIESSYSVTLLFIVI